MAIWASLVIVLLVALCIGTPSGQAATTRTPTPPNVSGKAGDAPRPASTFWFSWSTPLSSDTCASRSHSEPRTFPTRPLTTTRNLKGEVRLRSRLKPDRVILRGWRRAPEPSNVEHVEFRLLPWQPHGDLRGWRAVFTVPRKTRRYFLELFATFPTPTICGSHRALRAGLLFSSSPPIVP